MERSGMRERRYNLRCRTRISLRSIRATDRILLRHFLQNETNGQMTAISNT
jgi:hypothetical protein